MKSLVLAAAFLLVGCSTTNIKVETSKQKMVHGAFKEHVDRFKIAHQRSTGRLVDVSNIIIKPVRMNKASRSERVVLYKNETIAFCMPSNTLPAIYIDVNAWKRLPDLLREELIFHELGHCVLRRPHCDYSFQGLPVSIMRSYLVPMEYYSRYREHYHNELFKEPACQERF